MGMNRGPHAQHIGRVGALALALGVGTVVAVSPTAAWADPAAGESISSPAHTDTEPSAEPTSSHDPGADTPADSGLPATQVEAGAEETLADPGAPEPEVNPEPIGKKRVAGKGRGPLTAKTSRWQKDLATDALPSAVPSDPLQATPDFVPSSRGSDRDARPVTPAAPTVTAMTMTSSAEVPEAILVATTQPSSMPSNAVMRVLSVLAAPFLAGGTGAPVEFPGLWMLLAATRRHAGLSLASRSSIDLTAPTVNSQVFPAALPNSAPTATVTQKPASTSTGKVTGTVKAVDVDRDKLIYTAAPTAKGTVTVTSKGAFTYTPTAVARHAAAARNATVADKSDTFTITVSDGRGGSVVVAVDVVVTPANAAPSTKATVGKANPLTGTVAGSISDADGDALTITTITAPAGGGALSYQSDGTFTYVPTAAARAAARTAGKIGSDKFTVSVDDGHGGVKSVAITVTIAPSNTAPTGGAAALGAASSSTGVVKGKLTATDSENDALAFGGSGVTSKGKVSVSSTGAITYTPSAAARHAAATGAAGTLADTFFVTVTDKFGATSAISVTAPVLARNSVPVKSKVTVAQPDSATGVVNGLILATDPDKDVLTYAGTGMTAKGSLVVNANGTFTYTPNPAARLAASVPNALAADKIDTVVVTVSDGHGGIATVASQVAIARFNANPTVAAILPVGGDRLVVSPDGRYVYSTAANRSYIGVLDTATNTTSLIAPLGSYDEIVDVAVAPDGTRLYAVGRTISTGGSTVAIIDVASGTAVDTIDIAGTLPKRIALSPNGKTLVVIGGYAGEDSVQIIDVATRRVTRSVALNPKQAYTTMTLTDLAITPDGTRAWISAAGDFATPVAIVNMSSGAITRVYTGRNSAQSITISPDGKTVYADNLRINASTRKVAKTLVGIWVDAVSPDGRYLYGAGKVADSVSGVVLASFGNEYGGVAVSPDGSRLYLTDGSLIDVYGQSPVTIKQVGRIAGGSAITASVDGSRAFTFVRGWNSDRLDIIGADGSVTSVEVPADNGFYQVGDGELAVSSDGGRAFLSNTRYNTVIIFDLTGPSPVTTTVQLESSPSVIRASADGTRVYIGGSWGFVAIIDASGPTPTVQQFYLPGMYLGAITDLAVNADGSGAYLSAVVPDYEATTTTFVPIVAAVDDHGAVLGSINLDTPGTYDAAWAKAASAVFTSTNGGRAVAFQKSKLSVIDAAAVPRVTVVELEAGAEGMALSDDGRTAWVRYEDRAAVIDLSSETPVVTVVPLPSPPKNLAISSDGMRAWFGHSGALTVVDLADGITTVTTVVVPADGTIAVSQDGTRGYVSVAGSPQGVALNSLYLVNVPVV